MCQLSDVLKTIEYGADFSVKDNLGQTMMHLISDVQGDMDDFSINIRYLRHMVNLLLQYNPSMDCEKDSFGKSPLYYIDFQVERGTPFSSLLNSDLDGADPDSDTEPMYRSKLESLFPKSGKPIQLQYCQFIKQWCISSVS